MPSPSPIRSEFVFHGRVQGVGFRWTSAALAEAEGLEGAVSDLREEILSLLEELPGDVRISLNVVANVPDGIDEETRMAIGENCQILKMTSEFSGGTNEE